MRRCWSGELMFARVLEATKSCPQFPSRKHPKHRRQKRSKRASGVWKPPGSTRSAIPLRPMNCAAIGHFGSSFAGQGVDVQRLARENKQSILRNRSGRRSEELPWPIKSYHWSEWCSDANWLPLIATDRKWTLKNPWSVVMLPAVATFPYQVDECWVYSQLTDGVGSVDVSIALYQVLDSGEHAKLDGHDRLG